MHSQERVINLNCKDVQALFSDYYDDSKLVRNSAPTPRTAFEAHLKECAACAAEYEKYAQLLDDVRNLPEPEMPWGFHESLVAYVEAHTARKKWSVFRSVPQWAAVAASLVAVFMWGLVAFAPTGTDDYSTGYIPVIPFDSQDFIPIAPAMEELPINRSFDDIPQYDAYQTIDRHNVQTPEVDHENWLRRRFNIMRAIVLSLGAISLWGVAIFTLRKPPKT